MLCVCVCNKEKEFESSDFLTRKYISSRTGCSTIDVQSKQTMKVNKNLDEPTCLWHNCSLLISSLYHSGKLNKLNKICGSNAHVVLRFFSVAHS